LPHFFDMRSLIALLGLSLALPLGAQNHGSHEHGISTLDLAIDTHRVSALLQGPAHNFVGFEQWPNSEMERVRVEAARSALAEGETLLGLPRLAGCQQQRLEMEGVPDAWAAAAEMQSDAAAATHRNWRIEYRFLCGHADALRSLEPRLFETFKHTSELRWQLISGSHQDGGSLHPPGGRIGLPPPQ
jgi:hypothetical protein